MKRLSILAVGTFVAAGLGVYGCASRSSSPATGTAAAQTAKPGKPIFENRCPKGTDDKTPWPAHIANLTFCDKTCGPDGIGVKRCDKVSAATCNAESEKCRSTCVVGDCVMCGKCVYPEFKDEYACYQPPRGAPPACPAGVEPKSSCPTGAEMCLRPYHKDPTKVAGCACCSEKGTWGCALWDTAANTWK